MGFMKKFVLITIALIMPMFMFGQSYSALWKKVQEAEEKDLPKTQYEVLQQIVKKATKEAQYGQLLKAELMGAQAMAAIAPDSLKPEVDRIVAASGELITSEPTIVVQPLSTAVIRTIEARVGDTVEMGGLLGSAPVMPVHQGSAEDFIARGGRIPAPLHSLRN